MLHGMSGAWGERGAREEGTGGVYASGCVCVSVCLYVILCVADRVCPHLIYDTRADSMKHTHMAPTTGSVSLLHARPHSAASDVGGVERARGAESY